MYGIISDRMMADDLTMAYDGNRLSSLTDNAGEVLSEALPDIPSGAYSGNDFRYDAAGCVTRDMARGITHMAYHRPGIPARMETASGDSIVFVYTAAGEKLSETVYRSGVPTEREYAGPWELVDGKIDRVNLGQGYFDSSGTFHAYIRDIAANIIGVYRAEEDADEVEQHNEFFAYGSPTGISNTLITGADKNRRKHTGKEFISELGVDSYDFSARFLAPLTGRFDSPDPKAWDYTWLSPYTFCAADPINSSDPTGENYNVIFDEKNKTVTIAAKFFAFDGDADAANKSASFWNGQSGHFTYKYNGTEYSVAFDLSVETVSESIFSDRLASKPDVKSPEDVARLRNNTLQREMRSYTQLTGDQGVNTFMVTDDMTPFRDNTSMDVTGTTNSGISIVVDAKYADLRTPMHEMGHTLGLGHNQNGLMSPSQNDYTNFNKIYSGDIKIIIRNAIKGKPAKYAGVSAGIGFPFWH